MSTPVFHRDRSRPLLTEREVANVFLVAPRTVRRWANSGQLARVRVGGVTRYRVEDVDRLIHPDLAAEER
jgi:excisionase family DNA binding protein